MKLKISGKKEKLSIRQLTECALFLYVYFMVFSYTEYGHDLNLQYPNFFQIIRFACYFLCVVRIFLKDSYKKESFIVAIIAIGLCVLCAVTNGENLIFFYMLFLLAVNGCDSERIIKVCLYAQGIVLFVTTCLSMCGFIDNAFTITFQISDDLEEEVMQDLVIDFSNVRIPKIFISKPYTYDNAESEVL